MLLLALTEPKAHWRAYSSIGRPQSSVCMWVCMSILSNIFSETTEPIEAKFHVELPSDGGTKVCSNSPGHMTKMDAMPIYGNNLNLLLRNQKAYDIET